MLLARIKCHAAACGDTYEVGLYGDESTAKCPICGQHNLIPDQLPQITGFCGGCKKAIDNHPLDRRGNILHCP